MKFLPQLSYPFSKRRVVKKTCVVCGAEKRFEFGRCRPCFRKMDATTLGRLRKMSRAQREQEFDRMLTHPARPKFEYEGRESELIGESL